jgi:chromosomal replication initiation ATPase DnaA
MLLDMVKSYDEEKMQYIQNVWTQVVDFLAQRYDHKKIVSFLAKVGIIGIEESKQTVYIGVPNEFILTQVKKFFQKPLKEAVQEVYNPQFTVSFVVYDGFSK